MAGPNTVLVVDDSAPIREMIRTILAAHGYSVILAADGREAVQVVRAAVAPYIILLDIVMPLLDGLGVVAEIEGDPAMREMGHKIALMSSTVRLSAPDIPATAAQLVKPFTRQQLLAVVEAMRQVPVRGEHANGY